MKRHLCPCGRPIRVRLSRGRHGIKRPADQKHDLCQRCWKSITDKQRIK